MSTAQTQVTHGTVRAYTALSCRCPECRQAHTDYMRDYRRRRKATGHQRGHQCHAPECLNPAYAAHLCRHHYKESHVPAPLRV